jgi:hypothetical protein
MLKWKNVADKSLENILTIILMRNHATVCPFLDFYELSFALPEKLSYKVFSEWVKFLKFIGYSGRKVSKQSGNSGSRPAERSVADGWTDVMHLKACY